MSVPPQSAHFMHGSRPPRPDGEPLQNTTRYLCAAAYLDRKFRDRMITEFIDHERRAVVPSFGFDLEPVVLHCLRARRLILFRDLALLALTLSILLAAPVVGFIILAGLIVMFVFQAIWR